MIKKFYKFSAKRIGENNKSVKWYWRPQEHEMFHNDVYKNYLIKRRSNVFPEYKKFSRIFNYSFLKKFVKSSEEEPHIELLPTDEQGNPSYDSTLIWLYDGDYIETFIEHFLEFNNFHPKNFKILFYRAPINPITYDSVVLERAWFNIFNLPDAAGRREINKKEIENFNLPIQKEIQNQYNLIGDYSKIFLGGFSSSACMAIYSLMTCKEKLGGGVAFSGFNFDFTPLDEEKKQIPILCVNGIDDEVVILRHVRNSFSNMKKLGFNLQTVEEPGLRHFFTKSGLKYANSILSK